MRTLLMIAMLLGLTGCQTPAERAAQLEQEVDEMIQLYGPACEKLGFKPDSDSWRNCILRYNSSAAMKFESRRSTSTTCWGHRGFFRCSTW